MNIRIHEIFFLLFALSMPLSTQCAEIVGKGKKKPFWHKNSLTLPAIHKKGVKKKSPFQTLKAALLKKKPAPSSIAPITAPGLVASKTPAKTVDPLSQVRRESSSKPPFLIQSLPLSPLSPTSPDGLSLPLSSTTSSSGKSELSVLSSPSSVATASPLPSPSPDMPSILGIAVSPSHDVCSMLHTSPEITPESSSSLPSDCVSLPAPAQVACKERVRVLSQEGEDSPPSKHVHVGSLPQVAGSMRDELEDDDDRPMVAYEQALKPINVRALSYEEVEIVNSSLPAGTIAPVLKNSLSPDTWTPLMHAAWQGDVDTIRAKQFSFKDVTEWRAAKSGDPKMHALALARHGRSAVVVELSANIIEQLRDYHDDPAELIKRDLDHGVISDDLKAISRSLRQDFSDLLHVCACNPKKEAEITKVAKIIGDVDSMLGSVGRLQKIYDDYQYLCSLHDSYTEILALFARKALIDERNADL